MEKNRLVFLNHSALLIESNHTKVLCDPWFSGAAFNNGWRLLDENSHDINQIECDFIWVSHEHPDHFSVPTLSKLTAKKKFLYQHTEDKKVKNWLQSKGHTVTELVDAQTVRLDGLSITSFLSDGYDTAALFEFPNGDKVLNLNDARAELGDTISRIQEHDTTKLKVAAIQFSYANWAGNTGDKQIPQHQQDLVIERILKIHKAFKPEKVLLFASYVHCSHEENAYWNGNFWLRYAAERLAAEGIEVVIPQPNQAIELNEIELQNFDEPNLQAIQFWERKADAATIKDFGRKDITIAQIEETYRKWFDRLWAANDISAAQTPENQHFSLKVKLVDKNTSLEVFLFRPEIKPVASDDHDCLISSETLLFLFNNDFARGTVTVNARVQFNYETAHRFFIFFFISYANNIGRHFQGKRLNAEVLQSIKNTSVMTSILKFSPQAALKFERELTFFG